MAMMSSTAAILKWSISPMGLMNGSVCIRSSFTQSSALQPM